MRRFIRAISIIHVFLISHCSPESGCLLDFLRAVIENAQGTYLVDTPRPKHPFYSALNWSAAKTRKPVHCQGPPVPPFSFFPPSVLRPRPREDIVTPTRKGTNGSRDSFQHLRIVRARGVSTVTARLLLPSRFPLASSPSPSTGFSVPPPRYLGDCLPLGIVPRFLRKSPSRRLIPRLRTLGPERNEDEYYAAWEQ